MILPVWLYIVICGFAALGMVTFVLRVMAGSRKVMDTANNLVRTLKDATEIARAYREDLGILRQIAQSGLPSNLEDEPESIIPQTPAAPSTMPAPYFGRFAAKPVEDDAPAESVREVDVTATDEEIAEQEKEEAAVDLETQERLKAASRDADHERIKALVEQSGKPEGQ